MYPENIYPIPIDKSCSNCKLASNNAVSGNGPEDLSQIKLILISDYPGAYETEFGWPQVPNDWVAKQRDRKPKLPPRPNSGAFIRHMLNECFGLDTYTNMWTTNAVKCDPNYENRKLKVADRIMGICSATWLKSELYTLDQIVPEVPILAAGSWALKAVRLVYPDTVPVGGIDTLLRRSGLYAGRHPLVCTYNPATYARSCGQIETSVRIAKRTGAVEVQAVVPIDNYLYTTTQVYKADLARLNPFLLPPPKDEE